MDSKEVKSDGTMLRDAAFCRAVIAVLLMRLGGQPMVITQADLDGIVGLAVLEGRTLSGDFKIGLGKKGRTQ